MSPNEYAAVVKLYHSDYRAFPVHSEAAGWQQEAAGNATDKVPPKPHRRWA